MKFWQYIQTDLEAGHALVLLYVLQSKGSSPGRQGFKMVLGGSADMYGSIGGGFMEHKLVELARTNLKPGLVQPLLKRQIHRKSAPKDQSGMICSGEQTVVLLSLDQEHLTMVGDLLACLENGEQGTLNIDTGGIRFTTGSKTNRCTYNYASPTDWQYQEPIGPSDQVWIVGGGHVGLALSRNLRALAFQVHVVDDRAGLHTMAQNVHAHRQYVIDYAQIADLIPAGDRVWVAVMTFGYRSDKVVVRQLLGRGYRYLGLLGSAAKVAELFADLAAEGCSMKDLSVIKAPIGLPIGSKTPEEIAMSVAAEIILLKNTSP